MCVCVFMLISNSTPRQTIQGKLKLTAEINVNKTRKILSIIEKNRGKVFPIQTHAPEVSRE